MKHTYVYDHYYKYGEITEILRAYAEKYPELCRLSVLGTTPEGRELLLLSVTDTAAGGYEDKPAFYVEGNLHAGEVTGSMTVMYLLDTVFSNLDDPKMQAMLKKNTLYALPRVSPDGTEYYLTTPGTLRSVPRMHPYSEPQPGLTRQDIDGDGGIRMMRVKTPYGVWAVSEKDPRLMRRRLPDETEGDFYNVYDEGLIEGDWDGLEITPAPGPFGNDFNRNYPAGWQPEAVQGGSGDYPLIHPETRANADFLLAHPNVCAVIDMHTSGGQNLYTPGYKSAKEADPEDIALYKAMGKMAQAENGYPYINVHDEYMPQSDPKTYGGFDDFCHFMVGVPAMTIECWDLSERAGNHASYPPKESKSDEERENEAVNVLHWIDDNVFPDCFQPWTGFDHPQLGYVEIGGCDSKFISQNPPPAYLEQELEKHTRFLLRLPNILPDLKLDSLTTRQLDGSTWLVEAVCGNHGYMPTYVFKEGLKSKKLKGVSLELTGLELLEGRAKVELQHLQGGSGYAAGSYGVSFSNYRKGPMRKKASWLVKGNPGDKFSVEVISGKAGRFSVEGELK